MHIDLVSWALLLSFLVLVVFAMTSGEGRKILLVCGIALVAALAIGCKPRDTRVVVDTRPPAKVETVRYVSIPKALTAPVPVAEGSVDQVLDVARERKAQLQQCNGQLEQVRAVQGTKVPC